MSPSRCIELGLSTATMILRLNGLCSCIRNLPKGDFVRFEEINDKVVGMASLSKGMNL